jgi:hypothetical protein
VSTLMVGVVAGCLLCACAFSAIIAHSTMITCFMLFD